MKYTAKQIQSFCDPDDTRQFLTMPAISCGRVFACNAHLMINIPVGECEALPDEWHYNELLIKSILSAEAYLKNPDYNRRFIANLAEKEPCQLCDGTGSIECDLDGIICADEDDDITIEPVLSEETCYECNGTKTSYPRHYWAEGKYTTVHGFPVDIKYLAQIVELFGNDLLASISEAGFKKDGAQAEKLVCFSRVGTSAFAVLMCLSVDQSYTKIACGVEGGAA